MIPNNFYYVQPDQKEFKIRLAILISQNRDITVQEVLDLLRLYPDERISTTCQQLCFLTEEQRRAELIHYQEWKNRGK